MPLGYTLFPGRFGRSGADTAWISSDAPQIGTGVSLLRGDDGDEIRRSNSLVCPDFTKLFAHKIPEAATAGTPMPGVVLSPTR